ncbi:hypothetical protein [Planotetraspora sp. GP83]|uniref:hypothetical protein n=1 Tax=Planotetraspora sp. GP83 TaxID=3156264 RepID=UPI0035190EC5
MSGCCGPGPVIMSGPQTPRVDVETLLLCDVLADGTVAAQVLVEPVYDTTSGDRVATRTVDPVTGAAYTVQGTLMDCAATGDCEQFVGTLCYQEPATQDPSFTLHKFDAADPNYPGCLVGLDATDGDFPFIQYNDPITAWEGTYRSNTGTASNVEVSAPELGGFIDWSQFSPPIPSVPNAGIPAPYTGTAVFNGITVTLDVLTASAITTGTQYLRMGGTEHFKLSFSSPVTMKFGTQGFADPAAGNFERFCNVTATGTVTGAGEIRTAYGLRDCTTGETTWRDQVTSDPVDLTQAVVVPCPQAERDCASPTEPTATVGLCLADGTPIAVTVVRDCAGTVTSEGWLNLTTGAYSAGAPPAGTVACGESRSIQVSGTFCDIDPVTGDVLGLVLIEYTYDDAGAISSVRLVDAVTGGTYTPTGTVTVCPAGVEQPERDVLQLCDTATDGTVTEFVRDYARDENGAITGHSDYTLDGAAYTPTGTVTTCPTGTEQPEQDAVQLCDVAADGTSTPFLRDFRRDELGAITGHSDYTLAGAAYTPTGTVGTCAPPCLHCETVELCDSTAECAPGTSIADKPWSPRYLTAGDSATPAVVALRKNVPGGGAGFWSGGSTVFPNVSTDPDGGNDGVHYGIAGKLTAGNVCPDCFAPADQVTITVTGQAHNDGPGTGILTDGRFRILRDSGEANGAVPELAIVTDSNRPANSTWSFTATATVPWSDVLAGRIVLTLDLETRSNSAYKQWTASGLTVCITNTTPRPGCGKRFLRSVCRDCTGQVVSHTDLELDGITPYTPVGAVGECSACGQGEAACRHCETLLLCDDGADDPATIRGLGVTTGTLSNGVTWSSRGNAPTLPSSYNNADGAWWGQATFPNPVFPNSTWSFSQPVTVEFSVYIRYFASGTAGDNTAQLPTGLEVVSLPDGYTYDPITGILTVTGSTLGDPCAYLTDPHAATSARFRTANPVTSVTARYLGQRIANCGVFGNYKIGAFEVTASGQFLRSVCRDCTGAVISTTDTALDAVTPYTPIGTVRQCTDPQAEPCCQPVQVCIQQDPVQEVEFISNEEHRNNNTVDPVWKWTTDLTAANPTWYDMYQYQYSGAWSVTDSDTARPAWWVSPHPNGASAQSSPAQPNEGPSLLNTHWYPRAYFDLPDNADPATIKIQATVFNADQIGRAFRLNNGAWQNLPATATHNGTTYTFGPDTIPGAQAGRNFLYLDVEETVGGGSGLMVHLKVTYEVIPETRSWTRMVCCGDTIYYLDEDGQRQDAVPDGWHLAPCGGAASASTPACTKQIVERCGCDDTDGDGIGDVQYTELWAVDPCNGEAPALLGSYEDGDLTKPYTPVAPVECTTADLLPGPLSTGVRAVTGTAVQDIAATFPGAQSVSLTVLAGPVNVTMSDGTSVPVPAGVTLTWSVAQEADTALAAASFAGATATASYLLNWTYR